MEKNSLRKELCGRIILGVLFLGIILFLSDIYEVNREFIFYLISFFALLWSFLNIRQYVCDKKKFELYTKEVASTNREEMRWQIAREKEDFFAMWAHQIKTPIAALKVILQSEKQDIALCKQELFQIENYVEFALNYLRFESMGHDLLLAENNLLEMEKAVVKKFAAIFIHKHIAVKLEELDYQILTDEKWFTFVCEQIVSNALKYTREGCITISAKQENDGLAISIKDTGIGIHKEDLPRLFEKGFTGYNGRMDKKASGLGLYLCKGVCDKLGHDIRIMSEKNQGTEVVITVKENAVNRSELTKM